MTMTVFEFSDLDHYSGEPQWPAHTVTRAHGVANNYLQFGTAKPTIAIIVSNDDGTTGIRVRIGVVGTGDDATQTDVFIAANSTRTFYIIRKRRTAAETTDDLWINAVADS